MSLEDCSRLVGGSYWDLPPKGSQLVIGLLAEMADGQNLLAVTDYHWGSHEDLEKRVAKLGLIKRILWGGELLLENPEDQRGNGLVVFSINASGYVWSKMQKPGSIDLNEPQSLREALEAHHPNMTTPFTQHFYYSDEHAHLDPFFQGLHERVRFDKDDTARHRFRNILEVFVVLSHYFNKSPALPWNDQVRALNRISSNMMNDMISFLNSRAKYSAYKLQFQNKFQLDRQQIKSDEDFKKLVDLIKSVSAKVALSREEPEIIVLNP